VAENLQFNLNVETGTAVASINRFFDTVEKQSGLAKTQLNAAFGQELQTEVMIELKGGKAVAKEVQSLKQESRRLADVSKALNGEFGRTPGQIKRSIQGLRALRDNTAKFNKKTGEVRKSWELVANRIDAAEKELKQFYGVRPSGGGTKGVQDMGEAFTGAGIKARLASEAIILAVNGIKAAITSMADRARELGQLSVALQSFTRDAQQANGIMILAQKTGLEYGVSIQSVEKAWRRVGPAASAAGLSVKETNTLITSATARIAQMGLSGEQAGRYMEALAQVMGKGKLQGEELRQQFAELDGALRTQVAQFLAVEYGITSLDDAMQNGEVSAGMFAEALVSVSANAVERLKTSLGDLNTQWDQLNLEQKFNQLNNVFTVASQQWGDTFGPFVDSLGRAATLIGGYIATWQTRFPALAEGLKQNMARAGEVIEMTVYGLIIIFDLLSRAIEATQDQLVAFLKIVPGIGPAIDMIEKLNGEGSDMWADSVENARALMGEITNMKAVYNETAEKQMEMAMATTDEEKARQGLNRQLEKQRTLLGDVTEKQKEAKEQVKATKAAYDEQKKQLDDLVASMKARFDQEITKSKEAEAVTKQRIQAEKSAYKDLKTEVKDRYAAEKSELDSIYSRKLALLDMEASNLQKRTPSEEKLYQLEKEELILQTKSRNLSEEELLRLNARLERMNAQEQLEENALKKKELQKQKEQELAKLEEEKKARMKEIEEHNEKVQASLEKRLEGQKSETKEFQEQKKELGLLKTGTEVYNGEIDKGVEAVRTQSVTVQGLENEWAIAKSAVESYTSQIKQATSAANQLASAVASAGSPGGGGGDARAAGGPVAGGSTYTVNELGKEAFLSASGRLSMINAPSYGQWKAPGAGTVIPAHLTKQLDVPTGGVNINSSAQSNAMGAGRNGMGAMIRAIQSASGGDHINNTVTIQAQNPTQAASDMMVQMNKVRRRRYT